ncbi:unnamed protein product [Caretta caretta]
MVKTPWYVFTTRRIGGQQSIQRGSIYCVYSRHDKSTPERSPIDSCSPVLRELQAESKGEQQQSTHRGGDTTVSRSKYVNFSYVIHVAEVA